MMIRETIHHGSYRNVRVVHLARAWGWGIRADDVCQSCQNAAWDEVQS